LRVWVGVVLRNEVVVVMGEVRKRREMIRVAGLRVAMLIQLGSCSVPGFLNNCWYMRRMSKL
jgi:hypothetical protein